MNGGMADEGMCFKAAGWQGRLWWQTAAQRRHGWQGRPPPVTSASRGQLPASHLQVTVLASHLSHCRQVCLCIAIVQTDADAVPRAADTKGQDSKVHASGERQRLSAGAQ